MISYETFLASEEVAGHDSKAFVTGLNFPVYCTGKCMFTGILKINFK